MKPYIIVEDADVETLAEKVNKALAQGYKIKGPMREFAGRLIQPMMKVDERSWVQGTVDLLAHVEGTTHQTPKDSAALARAKTLITQWAR